jgi:hypothetical protein
LPEKQRAILGLTPPPPENKPVEAPVAPKPVQVLIPAFNGKPASMATFKSQEDADKFKALPEYQAMIKPK